jgi:ABC-type proline/glycine betaine transport system ATPase subunit
VADRIGMLHGGHLIVVGTPQEILDSDNEIVRTFVSRHAPLVREGRRQ